MTANGMGRAYTQPAATGKAQCERAGCDRPVKAQGMCERHYQRERHRHRQPTPARILRRRGRQRAMAALIERHKDEFKELLDYCTEIVKQENEQLRGELDASGDVVFLRPGPRPDDQEPVDRVTLDAANSVRCSQCFLAHKSGHRCPNCEVDETGFDEVAVENAIRGEGIPDHPADRLEAVRRLAEQGLDFEGIRYRLQTSQGVLKPLLTRLGQQVSA